MLCPRLIRLAAYVRVLVTIVQWYRETVCVWTDWPHLWLPLFLRVLPEPVCLVSHACRVPF